MDKELLRITILAVGGIVIIGIILWHTIKNQKPNRRTHHNRNRYNDYLGNTHQPSTFATTGNDNEAVDLSTTHADTTDNLNTHSITPPAQNPHFVVPHIVQFNIVAKEGQHFNGKDLVAAFILNDLQCSSMNVFERLDENKQVHYTIANMVEPGTFPTTNVGDYDFSGIVLFLQPMQLDKPLLVFDELITIIGLLSTRLDGIALDHDRQPLTQKSMQQLRTGIANLKK